jgi:hypothetical protein
MFLQSYEMPQPHMLSPKDKTANCHTRERKIMREGRELATVMLCLLTWGGGRDFNGSKKRGLQKHTSLLVPSGGGGGGGEGGGERGNRRNVAVSALRRLEAEPALSKPTKCLHNGHVLLATAAKL